MNFRKTLVVGFLALASAGPAWAATHYVAPLGAKVAGTPDGSKDRPWKDPLTALSKAKPGDTLLLMDGDYDGLKITNRNFSSPVTIRSLNGKNARLERIRIDGTSRNMVFQNLSVWADNPDESNANRVQTASGVTDVVFDGLDVRSSKNAASYPGWTKSQWINWSMKGFESRGARTVLKNSSFTGLGFAVILLGPETKAINNRIQGFSGDGIRVLGANSTLRGNLITDCVRVDANHADGIQSWSADGVPVKNLTIEKNTIIEWSNATVSPHRCVLQGIGLFDGYYDNLVIRNNIVSSTAYHGISVYGGRNVELVNNTVVHGNGSKAGFPWIGIFNHKNGKPSTDVTVANNLSMAMKGGSSSKNRISYRSNSVIVSPPMVMMDVKKFNYRPKADSGFIDSGNASFAPETDVMNHRRPAGAGPDRGAYEMNSTPATQDSGSSTTSTTSTAGKWLSAP